MSKMNLIREICFYFSFAAAIVLLFQFNFEMPAKLSTHPSKIIVKRTRKIVKREIVDEPVSVSEKEKLPSMSKLLKNGAIKSDAARLVGPLLELAETYEKIKNSKNDNSSQFMR